MAGVPMLSWMKLTRSASFSSLSTTDACEMPQEASSLRLLMMSEGEARRAPNLAPQREHGKGRQRDAVIDQKFLGQVLAAREHEPARIAAGIGHPQQLEIARDVLIVDGFTVKLLEQIENHVRFPALDFVADGLELVLHAERPHFVACRA